MHPKIHVLAHFTPWKRHILYFWCSFKKHGFRLKISKGVRFWIENYQNALGCDFEKIHFVIFWFEKNPTTQIINQLYEKASDIEMKILQRVRFWLFCFCCLPNFHSFIKTGHVSVIIQSMVWVPLVKFFC